MAVQMQQTLLLKLIGMLHKSEHLYYGRYLNSVSELQENG
jgi:hypothetical protein